MDRFLQSHESTGKITLPNIFEATEIQEQFMKTHLKEVVFADQKQISQLFKNRNELDLKHEVEKKNFRKDDTQI